MAMTMASTRHKRVTMSIRSALRTTILMLISAVVVGTLAPPAAALGGMTLTAGPNPAVKGELVIITAEIIPGAAGPNGGVFEFSIEDPFGDNADPVLVNADPDDVYGSYTFQPMTPGAYQIVVKYTASAGPGVLVPGSGPVKSMTLTVTARPQQVYSELMAVKPIKAGKTRVIAKAGADQTAIAQQPVSFAVSTGAKRCAVRVRKNGSVILKGLKPGKCAVQATAPGVPGEWAPYLKQQSYKIR